jgi:uncharacterized protein with GYD domain
MTMYLTRFSYTPETWARLRQNPEDRSAALRGYMDSVGGKVHGFWYAFGADDGFAVVEAPDNVSVAAAMIAIGAGGALSSFATTVLLTVEETLAALEKSRSVQYRPPGA